MDASGLVAALTFSSWLVYFDKGPVPSVAGLREVSVFAYDFGPAGRLVPAGAEVPRLLAGFERGAGPLVSVTVVNDSGGKGARRLKDPDVVHAALASEAARARHIGQLADLSAGRDGVEIDYENLRAADRGAFTAFIRDLAGVLHRRGQRLAVVVQPKTKDAVKDGAGAVDWRAVSSYADSVKVMAYSLHSGKSWPGPIAPPWWVAELARFGLENVPKEKLCVILALHGFDWPEGGTGAPLAFDAAMALAAAHGAPIERAAEGKTPHFRYQDAGGRHEVWFEDAASLRENIAGLERAGVSRVGLWRLGAGDPAFWSWLRGKRG